VILKNFDCEGRVILKNFGNEGRVILKNFQLEAQLILKIFRLEGSVIPVPHLLGEADCVGAPSCRLALLFLDLAVEAVD
jgi:hypothetical protein